MQHLQVEIGILGHRTLVEFDDIRIADTQAGSIEIEVGFFFGGDPDAHHGLFFNEVGQVFEFVLVIQHGDDVLPAGLTQFGDVLDVLRTFEAVADDIQLLFVHGTVAPQGFDEVQVVGR